LRLRKNCAGGHTYSQVAVACGWFKERTFCAEKKHAENLLHAGTKRLRTVAVQRALNPNPVFAPHKSCSAFWYNALGMKLVQVTFWISPFWVSASQNLCHLVEFLIGGRRESGV
jgi:hypothetical protein